MIINARTTQYQITPLHLAAFKHAYATLYVFLSFAKNNKINDKKMKRNKANDCLYVVKIALVKRQQDIMKQQKKKRMISFTF